MKIKPGEVLGMVGESGSGKSTVIYSILGILEKGGEITNGDIIYTGENGIAKSLLSLKSGELRKVRGNEIALIAQNPMEYFHPIRKIRSQLKDLVKCHKDTITYAEAENRMLEFMKKINLDNGERLLNGYAFELSGGMCQRVAIAMAMIMKPRLLIADEPVSALDVTVQSQVVDELLKIREEYNTAIFMVSHNIGIISKMSDKIAVMFAGIILEIGTRDDIIKNPYHIYTKNLISAIPKMNESAPTGIISFKVDRCSDKCPIYDNCVNACENCSPMPSLVEVEPGHFVRCCKYGGISHE